MYVFNVEDSVCFLNGFKGFTFFLESGLFIALIRIHFAQCACGLFKIVKKIKNSPAKKPFP